MITKQPWFGPKRFGWGWTPVSWQGWLATLLIVVAAALGSSLAPRQHALVVVAILVPAFILLVWLTGTKPGGSWRLRRRP